MSDFVKQLFSLKDLQLLNHPEALLYLLVAFLILLLARTWHSFRAPYRLVAEITERDNPAAAVSFGGFMFGVALILWGVLSATPLPELWKDLLDMALMGVVGMVLLTIAQAVNDRVIFRRFDIQREIADKNLAAGLAEAGSYVGSALIVMRSVGTATDDLALTLVRAAVFFVAGQIAFLLFALLYQRTTSFDLHAELRNNNAAAGVAVGMSLTAMGVLLSHAVSRTDSLVMFALWFAVSAVLLLVFRLLLDAIILPGHRLDNEIGTDKNWGAALLEGIMAVALSLVLTTVF